MCNEKCITSAWPQTQPKRVMATRNGNHTKPLAWPSVWILLLPVSLMFLPQYYCMLKSNAVCSGQQLSISCGDQRLVHILYETYSYTATPCTNDLDPELVECTKAEFLVPVSVDHCNGRASCTFAVPTNTTISSCGQTATALWVHYACIPKSSIFDICSNFAFERTQQLYLTTPNFPQSELGMQKKCSCNLIGQNITGIVLQHSRDPDSSVVMTLSTDHGTQHINGLNILNTVVFYNITRMSLVLENNLHNQNFKVWLQFRGTRMSLKCNYVEPVSSTPVPIEPTTVSLWTNQSSGEFFFSTNIMATSTTSGSQSNTANCERIQDGQTIDCENHGSTTANVPVISSYISTSTMLEISPTQSPNVGLSTEVNASFNLVTMATPKLQSSEVTVQTDSILYSATSPLIQPSTADTNSYTVTATPSGAGNTNETSFESKFTNADVTLLAVFGCVAFLLLVAMVAFTVIMWKRANPNQHPSKDTHIYDAYHHDNGSLEPEPAGVHHHGKSSLDPDPIGASLPQYDTIADQSVLI